MLNFYNKINYVTYSAHNMLYANQVRAEITVNVLLMN